MGKFQNYWKKWTKIVMNLRKNEQKSKPLFLQKNRIKYPFFVAFFQSTCLFGFGEVTVVIKKCGKLWKNASEEELAKYKDRSKTLKEKYDEDLAVYIFHFALRF